MTISRLLAWLTLLTFALAGDLFGQAGDTCATPAAISGFGVFSYDVTGHSTSVFNGGNGFLCASNAQPLENDGFFVWTASTTGAVGLRECSSSISAVIYAHDGADCSAVCLGGTALDCQSDGIPLVLQAVAGDQFLIQVGVLFPFGPNPYAGGVEISPWVPPAQDECSGAIPISGSGEFSVSTAMATTSDFNTGVAPCSEYSVQRDSFYQWTATEAGDVQFSLITDYAFTGLQVSSGVGCAATCIASDMDNGTTPIGQAIIRIADAQIGETYLVQVGSGSPNQSGDSTLIVGPWEFPPNNDCQTPTPIVGFGHTRQANTGATTSAFTGSPSNPACDNSAGPGANLDLFFSWVAPCSGLVKMEVCGGNNVIAVYEGSDCSATCIGGVWNSDDPCGALGVGGTALPVLVSQGASYLIQVGGFRPPTTSFSQGSVNLDLWIAPLSGGCDAGMTFECGSSGPVHYAGRAALLTFTRFGMGFFPGAHIVCSGGPPGEFGFLLVSSALANPIPNLGTCLAGPIGRYNRTSGLTSGVPQLDSTGVFDADGFLQTMQGNASIGSGFEIPTTLPPGLAGQTILPGDTWYFQCWFRDRAAPNFLPGSASNYSNAVGVTF